MTLHILVIDENRERSGRLKRMLQKSGYSVTEGGAACDIDALVGRTDPDVVIIDMDSPSRDVVEGVVAVRHNHPRPMVLFTHDDDTRKIRAAVQAGVSAYVVSDVQGEKIRPIIEVAVAQYQEFAKLRDEIDRNQRMLAERKWVERAKGILMQQRGCTEDEAYQLLRKLAMDRKARLADIAQNVVSVSGLLLETKG